MTEHNGIVVREAGLPDEAATNRLVKTIFPFPDEPHKYAQNVRYPSECINVVAEVSGNIVGYASLLIDASPQFGPQEWRKYDLYIGVVAVDERYRRHRICTRMLGLIEKIARARAHHTSLHLHVDQVNEPAIRCFQELGFERIAEVGPGPNGERAWLMRKKLAA
jgi:ribosomal protein S18 acetylase RimI-like enzyme